MTLANRLTLARVVAIPFFVLLVEWSFPHHLTCAAVLFTLAAVTDFFDGYFARRLNSVSGFGKIFDPLADKLLVLAALMPLVVSGRLSPWVAFILIGRELLVSAVRVQASSHGGEIIAASVSAKVKTVLQDVALVMMLLETDLAFLKQWYVSDLVMAAALLFTVWSMAEYCYHHRGAFKSI